MKSSSGESELQKTVRVRLAETLGSLYSEILDRSDLHRGHAGARAGGGHFDLVVVSPAFEGLSLLERHRAVYQALGDLFKEHMHALALKAFTAGEWERRRLSAVQQKASADEGGQRAADSSHDRS